MTLSHISKRVDDFSLSGYASDEAIDDSNVYGSRYINRQTPKFTIPDASMPPLVASRLIKDE
jgi:hypothetical protein